MIKSVDPDQMTSSDVIWSGSTQFSMTMPILVQQKGCCRKKNANSSTMHILQVKENKFLDPAAKNGPLLECYNFQSEALHLRLTYPEKTAQTFQTSKLNWVCIICNLYFDSGSWRLVTFKITSIIIYLIMIIYQQCSCPISTFPVKGYFAHKEQYFFGQNNIQLHVT